MGLHLTGKGSILDALKTGANATVAGVKDIGDVIGVGAGNLTGNQEAAGNARTAISNNDANLSNESLGENLGGLSGNLGITDAARAFLGTGIGAGGMLANKIHGTDYTSQEGLEGTPLEGLEEFASNHGKVNLANPRQLAGNTLKTGINLATLGKGKLVEELAEKQAGKIVGEGIVGKAAARIIGSSATGAGYGAGQGSAEAVANAKSAKEAATDIIKPAVQNAAVGGVIGGITTAPALIRAGVDNMPDRNEIGAIGGNVNEPAAVPSPAPEDEVMSALHAQNPNPYETPTGEALPPEPGPEELKQATDNLHADMHAGDIDWGKVAGAGQEFAKTTNNVAKQLREQDRMEAAAKGPTDLYKRIRAAGGIGSSDYEDIPNHLKRKAGQSMDRLAQELGFKDDAELHGAIEREDAARTAPKGPGKSAAEYRDAAQQYVTAHPEEFDNVARRAAAESHHDQFQAADKGSGYDRAKWQIPKGAPARKFIQALYDKTHSPEYTARNNIGARLGDVRNTMKGIKTLRDRAQRELDALTKKGSKATEEEIRAKAAEVRTQSTRYNALKGQEVHHALSYKTLATALDEKFPDFNLNAKPGVRLTSNAQTFETARPIQPPPETLAAGKPITPADTGFTPPETTPYTGPNLNEGAFNAEDRAKLEADNATAEAEHAKPRNIEGDNAILDGIKNGDSDASIIKAYMDATGASEAEAKKVYGLIEDDPNVEKVGAVENNPYHGKIANYDVGKAPEPGKIFSRAKGATRDLINKSLLRATAYGDQLAFKLQDATHLWQKLDESDQALADKLRDHSIESVAAEAKDPAAFTAYATRAKDIQDYIHSARGIADPADVTPYRQRYGAGFHLEDANGKPISINPFKEGQGHAFQMARHYNNYGDIEGQTGLTRSTADFHEDVTKDVVAAQRHTAVNSLYQGLKQAFGDDAVSGTGTTEANVPLKDFDGIYARRDIANRINSRARYEYTDDKLGSLLRGYDKVNASMKNVKLSAGGFHNVNILLNQAALDARGIGASTRAMVSDDAFRTQMNKWDADGTMEKALHSGLTLGGGSEFESGINKFPVVKQLHEALFKRQIPYSKMQIFQKFTRDMDLNNSADYDQMRGAARSINNTFGGINRLVDGMTPSRMKQFSRGILAVDYNEGQIRTLLTALDPSKLGTVEGRLARQVVAGRASILATPGVLQAVATGQIGSNPKDVSEFIAKQYVDPTIATGWKTPGGTPKRISLIAGIVNKTDRAVAPMFDKNNPNKFSGVDQEATGNLSPAASLLESEKINSDYYGNKVRTGNVAHDVGAVVSAASPIPTSPAARAVEGTRFGKNGVVTTLAGGQPAISPGEALTDISGIGRVSADPNSPQMKVFNSQQLVAEGLKTTEDKAALQAVHPSWDGSLSPDQVKAIYANPQYEINKWNVLRQNQNVYDALKKQDQVARDNGQPGNPLFDLPQPDYKLLTEYEFLKHADEGPGANNTAAVIYAQNKDMIDNYEQANQDYQGQLQDIYTQTKGQAGDNAPVEAIGGAPNYTPTDQQVDLSNQYFGMDNSNSTSAQRAQFLKDNPELVQLFNVQFQAENLIRQQQNEPLLKPFPTASPEVSDFLNKYSAADKATRAGLRAGSPDLYNQMSNYFAQVDEYDLAKTAGRAQFQNTDLSQANLKEIYNLGQYDISKQPGADGADTYVVDPQAAYAAKSGAGGSGAAGGLSASDRRSAKLSVKYAYHTSRTKIRGQKRVKYTKARIKTGPRPKVSLKTKPTRIA